MGRARTEVHEITSASESTDADLQRRKIKYMLSMAVRIVLFPAALILHGPLRWVALAVAVVIPAIAVVFANTKGERRKGAGGRFPDQSAVVPLGPSPRTGH